MSSSPSSLWGLEQTTLKQKGRQMSLGSLNMGGRTELGWGCKEATRLCEVALDDRSHSSVHQAGLRVRRYA